MRVCKSFLALTLLCFFLNAACAAELDASAQKETAAAQKNCAAVTKNSAAVQKNSVAKTPAKNPAGNKIEDIALSKSLEDSLNKISRFSSEAKYDQALVHIQQTLQSIGPNSRTASMLYVARAGVRLSQGDYDATISDLSQALALAGANGLDLAKITNHTPNLLGLLTACYNGRFTCYLIKGELAKANAEQAKLLLLEPERETELRLSRARLYIALGQSKNARAELNHIPLQERKSNPEIGECYSFLDQFDRANAEEQADLLQEYKLIMNQVREEFSNKMPAIAKKSFDEAHWQANDEQVRYNMRTFQIVLESYAVDHDGNYPLQIDGAFKTLLSSGAGDKKIAWPQKNPFTGKLEWPVLGKFKNLTEARSQEYDQLARGAIEYTPLDGGKGYGIRGGGHDGRVLRMVSAPAKVLVISSDEDSDD